MQRMPSASWTATVDGYAVPSMHIGSVHLFRPSMQAVCSMLAAQISKQNKPASHCRSAEVLVKHTHYTAATSSPGPF